MSIEQKMCQEKTFQLQSMSDAIRCINKGFAVYNSGISCLANMTRYTIFSSRLMQTHGLVVKASHSESGYLGLISIGC